MKKDTERYASERGLYLKLSYLYPTANTEEGEELPGEKVGAMMRIKEEESRTEEVRQQKWQGKLIEARWDDADVIGCFYAAGKLRPHSYSALRFTNSTRQRQATMQTSSAVCAEKMWRASLMF